MEWNIIKFIIDLMVCDYMDVLYLKFMFDGLV